MGRPRTVRPQLRRDSLGSMANIPLSDEARLRLHALFTEADRATAAQLLIERCGNNLPFLENAGSEELDRFRFAALKISAGSLPALYAAVALANEDWRDLLVAAGFAEDVGAHLWWIPDGMLPN